MEPRETLLMAFVPAEDGGHESEPVMVEVQGGDVVLRLADGGFLLFDAAELRSALAPASLRSAA